ncbi:hypothetical protein CC78DRAFT_10685 [Lojkania enalia]|uniref:Uncharacterized protein n=1 Tax=Lojkania enalia TaxID=147567 RepID=A0A9P4ND84_9PLEO|nr:hypothetical protein CC78DRAFT_10685 [Didymosphaeria enalia]
MKFSTSCSVTSLFSSCEISDTIFYPIFTPVPQHDSCIFHHIFFHIPPLPTFPIPSPPISLSRSSYHNCLR